MNFRTGFRNTQVSTVIKIRPVTAKLLCVDGQTDRETDTTKLTDFFAISRTCLKFWRNTSKTSSVSN